MRTKWMTPKDKNECSQPPRSKNLHQSYFPFIADIDMGVMLK